jgi:hypothetical protein
MTIRITNFAGIAPRVKPHNLARQMAVVAENVDLSRGSLMPFRKPRKLSSKTGEYLFKTCCEIVSQNCNAQVVDMQINCGLFASTNIMPWPALASESDACAGNWTRLGFPCPIAAPTATPTAGLKPFEYTDHSRQLRSYKIRLVNKFNQNSAPSPESNFIEVNSMTPVNLTLPTSFPAEYGITKVQIYASEQSPDISGKSGFSGYFYIGEVDAGVGSFTDNRDFLSDELDSEDFDAPPDNLQQLQYWQSGELAGLSGEYIAFSIKNHPHAWPQRFRHRIHGYPKALIVGKSVGFVATDGRPAIIRPKECNMMGCHAVIEHDDSHPIASVRSMAIHNEHAIWATQDGLLMISPNMQTMLLTRDFFTQGQWREIAPETMIGEVHDGCYYGFTDKIGFRLRIPDQTYDKQGLIDLVTINLGSKPKSLYRSHHDELYLLMVDGVYWWNEGDEFLTLRWKSSDLDTTAWTAFTAYKIEGDFEPATIRHWCDNELVDTDIAANNRPMRLNTHSGTHWQFEIETTGEVSTYSLGQSVRNLALGQQQ